MRISGWLIGIVGFSALIFGTGLCAVLFYGSVRGVVVDLWDSGVRVDAPGDLVLAISNPEVFVEPSATPDDGQFVLLLPSPTPAFVATAETSQQAPTGEAGTVPPLEQTPAPADPTRDAQGSDSLVSAVVDPADEYAWNDPRQINLLLMGIDQRSATEDRGPFRTDTMIMLNVNPVRKTVGVISIPRDLWVNIPNVGAERINSANRQGDLIAYPGGGGPALAMETIRANFGVNVTHYVIVNFDLFEQVVDALAPNGVEVCVRENIYDPKYPDAAYGTIIVEFQPGCQRLSGPRLLQYARTRATEGSDFDRARRQQEVLDAVRAEVLNAGGVSNFLTQIPLLWQNLSDSYRTNLSLSEIISLGFLMGEIDSENINFAVIDANYVNLGKSPTGDDVLQPIWSRINDLVQRVFYPQAELSRADLLSRSQAENATIRVYNGTEIAGLASRSQEWLIGRGIQVASLGNDMNHGGQPTVIRDYGGNRWTALYLADLMGLSPDRIQPGTDGLAADGIIIVVGPDIETVLNGQ